MSQGWILRGFTVTAVDGVSSWRGEQSNSGSYLHAGSKQIQRVVYLSLLVVWGPRPMC